MERRKTSRLPGRIDALRSACTGYWGERALAQVEYAARLSDVREGRFDDAVERALAALARAVAADGAVGRTEAEETERLLAPAAAEAKSLTMLCAAHAHTDMNWMWGWNETVDATLSTFRTMLSLLEEYPDFVFSQSQAAAYRIVEQYDPGMLEEIRGRVREGRWEVTASTWVEPDRNLPSGESFGRQVLQARQYLCETLGLDPASLDLDFEPDAFGHNANLPEILSKSGVRAVYFCRGFDRHTLFRWRAPSGAEVVAYREPQWYSGPIDAWSASPVPENCAANGFPMHLKVYGVGDHGGGPTRRDVERLLDMATWPVFPTLRFGTFREFFGEARKAAAGLPVFEGELNFVFPGCYTSQTRLKTANRVSEARMDMAERFGAAAAATAGAAYPADLYREAWRKVLFNQFHDILPGSGTIETREHAMGQFQEILASADAGTTAALRGIGARIDTAALPAVRDARADTPGERAASCSEGAGAGLGLRDFVVPRTERGRGRLRILHFHNPSAHERREAVAATVWDWPGDVRRIEVVDASGRELPFQLEPLEDHKFWPKGTYWDHQYFRLFVKVPVPALGYATAVLRERDESSHRPRYDKSRLDRPEGYVLENSALRAEFDPATAALRSLLDKASGRELVDGGRFAGFRRIDEDDKKQMTAWVVGRTMNVRPVAENVRLEHVRGGEGAMRSVFSYIAPFGASRLSVEISLEEDSSRLDFDVSCDYRETAVPGTSVPRLDFTLPLGYPVRGYRYDIPFGTIDRVPVDLDVPAASFGVALPQEGGGPGLMLLAEARHGFRGSDGSLSLSLIRASYDPDPTPEYGAHRFRFAVVAVADPEDRRAGLETSYDFSHPVVYQPGTVHSGHLPAVASFLSLEDGRAAVTAVKPPEGDPSGRSVLVRLHETEGLEGLARLRFGRPVRSVAVVGLDERPLPQGAGTVPKAEGARVECPLAPFEVVSLLVGFEEGGT